MIVRPQDTSKHDFADHFRALAERQALRWVQQYISAFHGDPSKVTM